MQLAVAVPAVADGTSVTGVVQVETTARLPFKSVNFTCSWSSLFPSEPSAISVTAVARVSVVVLLLAVLPVDFNESPVYVIVASSRVTVNVPFVTAKL